MRMAATLAAVMQTAPRAVVRKVAVVAVVAMAAVMAVVVKGEAREAGVKEVRVGATERVLQIGCATVWASCIGGKVLGGSYIYYLINISCDGSYR